MERKQLQVKKIKQNCLIAMANFGLLRRLPAGKTVLLRQPELSIDPSSHHSRRQRFRAYPTVQALQSSRLVICPTRAAGKKDFTTWRPRRKTAWL
jgi:hypothetical protein